MRPGRQRLRRARLVPVDRATPQGQVERAAGRSFEVAVDELVVSGFSRTTSRRLAVAFEHELTRLLDGTEPRSRVSRHVDVIDGGSLRVRTEDRPELLARRAARVVAEGIES